MSISGNCKPQTPLGFSNFLNEKNNNHPSPGRVEDKWLSVVDILIYGTNMVFLLRESLYKGVETHRLCALQANPLDITHREKQKCVFKSLLFRGSKRNKFPPSLFLSFLFFFFTISWTKRTPNGWKDSWKVMLQNSQISLKLSFGQPHTEALKARDVL